jgi:Helicase associated domain
MHSHTTWIRTGVWVAKQRSQRVKFENNRRSSMTPRRMELLDEVGFDWGTRRGDAAWTNRYNELVEFFRTNRHSNYPTRTGQNRRLGRFVTEQRRLHRLWQQGLLSGDDLQRFVERMPLLESIQFRWAMQGLEAGNEDASGQVQDESDTSSCVDDGGDDVGQV